MHSIKTLSKVSIKTMYKASSLHAKFLTCSPHLRTSVSKEYIQAHTSTQRLFTFDARRNSRIIPNNFTMNIVQYTGGYPFEYQRVMCLSNEIVRFYTTNASMKNEKPKEPPTKKEELHRYENISKKSPVAKQLLQPLSFEQKVDLWKQSMMNAMKKVPQICWNIVVFLSKKSWEFIKRPTVVKDWYIDGTARTKKFVKHYVDGFKLFCADVRTASQMIKAVLQGQSLTRRQRIQLMRTVGDMFRIVPFLFFVIVPMAEFALPVVLKLFPNMLPSQFQDVNRKEEQLKKDIRARIELAKFLQDTISLMAHDLKKSRSAETVATAEELQKFIEEIRDGKPVTNEDIIRFAKLFKDEITLDNISRPQLIAMCRYMGLSTYGTDSLLRYRLNSKLRQIKADDRLIHWEGVNSLSMEELIYSCQDRGMKIGLPKAQLQQQLKDWLQLSLNKEVPPSLLILSRSFIYGGTEDKEEAIKLALSTLPDNVIKEVSQETPSKERDYEINQKKLDKLKRQDELIREELETHAKLDMDKKSMPDEKITAIAEAIAAASTSSLSVEKQELEQLREETLQVDDTVEEHPKILRFKHRVAEMIADLEEKLEAYDELIGNALHLLDKDKDGVLSVQEIKEFLKNSNILKDYKTDEERNATVEEIVKKFDRDQDGKVSVKQLVLELKEAKRLLKSRMKLE